MFATVPRLLTKRTYFIPALVASAAIAIPGASALADGGDQPDRPKIGLADARPLTVTKLVPPLARFHHTIDVVKRKMVAERRANARRERRQLFASLPAGV